jgi:hypothetical protein
MLVSLVDMIQNLTRSTIRRSRHNRREPPKAEKVLFVHKPSKESKLLSVCEHPLGYSNFQRPENPESEERRSDALRRFGF